MSRMKLWFRYWHSYLIRPRNRLRRPPSPRKMDRILKAMRNRCQVRVPDTIGERKVKRLCLNERPCPEHEVSA